MFILFMFPGSIHGFAFYFKKGKTFQISCYKREYAPKIIRKKTSQSMKLKGKNVLHEG